MKSLSKLFVISCVALSALALARDMGIDLRAQLTGMGKGKAEFKMKDRGARAQAELEVEGEHLARNATFTVEVGANPTFTVTTDQHGSFEFEQNFRGATAPVVNAGDSVLVTDSTSTVVLSGIFQAH